MGFAYNRLDRLLPRHETTKDLDLDWHVRTGRRGMFGSDEERSERASIVDISLEGARIEVDAGLTHKVGEHVAVRFRGVDAEAVVRHVHEPVGDRRAVGVRFPPNLMLSDALNEAVGELRGHSSELTQAWTRQN